MNNTIVISTPPHVRSNRTTKHIMLDVLIALLPATIMGVVFFGIPALIIELVAVAGAVATEFVYYFIQQGGFSKNALTVCKKWWNQFDYTSAITGLILALIVSPVCNWYEVLIASVFSIAVVKMLFGGTGKNLVNPAAAGRVFMTLCAWGTAFAVCNIPAIFEVTSEALIGGKEIDGIIQVGATVLSGNILVEESTAMHLLDLLLGTGVAGTIGETCKVAIIAGGVYLVVRKVIKWWQPILYILVAGLVGALLMMANLEEGATFDFINTFLSLMLSGGLIFGAVFMATDYVTSPKGTLGQIVYYVALGLLTAVLRHFTNIEVVSFVIMLMNLIVPLIDRYIVRKPFGYKREKKEVK